MAQGLDEVDEASAHARALVNDTPPGLAQDDLLADFARIINHLTATVNGLSDRMDQMSTRMDQRFDDMDGAITRLTNKVTQHEQWNQARIYNAHVFGNIEFIKLNLTAGEAGGAEQAAAGPHALFPASPDALNALVRADLDTLCTAYGIVVQAHNTAATLRKAFSLFIGYIA